MLNTKQTDETLGMLLRAHALLNRAMDMMAEILIEDGGNSEPKTQADKTQPEAPAKATRVPTAAEVRGTLAKLAKAGKRDDVVAILGAYGATKFSELSEENYAGALERAQALA